MAEKNSSRDSDSSPTHKTDSAHHNLKTLCKQKLRNRVFLGHYQEKRYVARLRTYKDLVILSMDEKAFRQDVETVFKRIQTQMVHKRDGNDVTGNVWLGFTGPAVIGAPAGYCVWTKLDETESTLAFGQYWFLVRTVRFKEQEIEIRLVALRSAEMPETNTTLGSFTDDPQQIDWSKLFMSWKNAINQNTFRFMYEQITAANMVAAIKFVALVVVLIICGLGHSIKYLGDFTLRFMHEFSKLVRAFTPFMLGVLDMFSKIVGGFFILLAMMWGDAVGGGRGAGGPAPLPAIEDRDTQYRYQPRMHNRFNDRYNSAPYRRYEQ